MPDFLHHLRGGAARQAGGRRRPARRHRDVSSTWAELERPGQPARNVLLAARAPGPGTKVVWCGQNSIGVVADGQRRPQGRARRPCRSNYRLSDEEAAYVVDHCDATVAFVDAEMAPMFGRIRAEIPKVTTVLVYGGADAGGHGRRRRA